MPSDVSDLLMEGVATFLRRADRINLHEAAIAEVTASYSELFSQGGISISPDLIAEEAEATEGYPFLIQLVGYYLCLEAGKAEWKLDRSQIRGGIATAQRRNTLVVVESALSDISDRDRDFLDAMTTQDGPSAAGQIGGILKAKPNVISKYRNRLIAAGLIESAGYGKVDFAIPGLRQYLREEVDGTSVIGHFEIVGRVRPEKGLLPAPSVTALLRGHVLGAVDDTGNLSIFIEDRRVEGLPIAFFVGSVWEFHVVPLDRKNIGFARCDYALDGFAEDGGTVRGWVVRVVGEDE